MQAVSEKQKFEKKLFQKSHWMVLSKHHSGQCLTDLLRVEPPVVLQTEHKFSKVFFCLVKNLWFFQKSSNILIYDFEAIFVSSRFHLEQRVERANNEMRAR